MTLLLLTLAAVSYVFGGLAMKWSDGLRVLWPSVGVFVAFCIGSALQGLAMRYESLSVGYVVVLGLEAVLAVLAGVLLLHEEFPTQTAIGVILVVIGIAFLKSA